MNVAQETQIADSAAEPATSSAPPSEPTVDASPDRGSGEFEAAPADRSGHGTTPTAVSEARRYRKRAQAAEQTLESLRTDLAEREKTIAQHEHTIKALQQRQEIDQALLAARAIDVESARLHVEAALAKASKPDAGLAVSELQRTAPHLFSATRRTAGAGTLAPKPQAQPQPEHAAATRAAAQATTTGKRSDLLRYLRLRRQ